jgi:hypothetical protein
MRFWIAGESIGDWNEEATLGVLLHSASVIMRYKNCRHLHQADTMGTEELWRHVERFAYSDDADDLQIGVEERYRQRFLIHELADDSIASVCKVILVERADGIQRLLWQTGGSVEIHELILPKLTVDHAIRDFIYWAETIVAQ